MCGRCYALISLFLNIYNYVYGLFQFLGLKIITYSIFAVVNINQHFLYISVGKILQTFIDFCFVDFC